MLHSIETFLDFSVEAPDGDAGEIADVYFDDQSWAIRYVVVATGSWLSGRQVLVAPEAFGLPDFDDEVIPVNLTREQVENAPDIDLAEPVSHQQLADLNAYYGWSAWWPTYWVGSPTLGVTGVYPAVPPADVAEDEDEEREEERGDPHLRSAREVEGYHIEATDGEIGHVEDFFADLGGWQIRYLLVDTRNLLPGKKVLLAPAWIDEVEWDEAQVDVVLTRAQVKDSPEYDPDEPLTREYETTLYGYYGRPGYWEEDRSD